MRSTSGPGKAGKGALLRREGLSASLLSQWRKQRDKGALAAFQPPRGRPPVDPVARENARLTGENARLRDQLARQAKVIEVQGTAPRWVPGSRPAATSRPQASRPTRPRRAAERRRGHRDQPACAAAGHRGRVPGAGVAPRRATTGPIAARRHRHARRVRRRTPQPRALAPAERQAVLDVLHQERFCDQAPASVWATLLDGGVDLASVATMDRLLGEGGETGGRRRHATHPARVKPELVATAPNRVWSWDITRLHGPAKWVSCYLSAILDVFSRYAVGWMAAERESAALAERLLADTSPGSRSRLASSPSTPTGARRWPPSRSRCCWPTSAWSEATAARTCRTTIPLPRRSSETLTHHPTFPDHFGSIQDARSFCQTFFGWYNFAHHHAGIALLTPADVHVGRAGQRTIARAGVLDGAYAAHPERFVRQPPEPPRLPGAVWINKPVDQQSRLSNSPADLSHRA